MSKNSEKSSENTIEKLQNLKIDRVYKCCSCGGFLEKTQKLSDDFLKKCPHCDLDELVIHAANMGGSIIINSKGAKTLGMQASKNTELKEKREGPLPQKYKPWWRKKKGKLDLSILKNPKKYIEKGHT